MELDRILPVDSDVFGYRQMTRREGVHCGGMPGHRDGSRWCQDGQLCR